MKSNIIIIGLDYKYNLEIGKLLADTTNLYFLDVMEYVNYTLFSRKDMQEKCGVEYLEKQENSAIKGCLEFENMVMTFPYVYFNRNANNEKFRSNATVIYLYFSKEKLTKKIDDNSFLDTLSVDVIAFNDRDKELNNASDIKINVRNKKKQTVINEIVEKLRSIL